MAENENLASILVKSGVISILTNSPIGYFSILANDLHMPRQRKHSMKSEFSLADLTVTLDLIASSRCVLRSKHNIIIIL